MTLTVVFVGTKPITAPGLGEGYAVWSYTVQPGTPLELPVGERLAFALPSGLDLKDPRLFPGVPELADMFLQVDAAASRQYAGRVIAQPGPQTVAFVGPDVRGTCEAMLVRRAAAATSWTALTFAVGPPPVGPANIVQIITSPPLRTGPPVTNGRPVTDFAGTLPYATELFGVYQPLAGWLGRSSAQVRPALESAPRELLPAAAGLLSPVGLVNLFREYFFEFDTFLGAPAGHIWISPGGTVEVVESSTRRTLVERTAEQSQEDSRKVEESLTQQDDVADAVKEDNANDTKLGVTASGGGSLGVYHAEASASFSTQSTRKTSAETTHKRSRIQTSKVTSEIKRNFKTTFKTVTETTDTTSRRYVVQNTTSQLVNYELRRKMRKVGVQLQHIGTRLSWQVFLEAPGRELGLGDLVHVIPPPDLTSVQKPDVVPYPAARQETYHLSVPFVLYQGADHDANNTYQTSDENQDHGIFRPDVGANDIVQFRFDYPLPPPPDGFRLSRIGALDFHGAQVRYLTDSPDLGTNPDPVANKLALRLTYANWGGQRSMPFDAVMVYEPTSEAKAAIDQANAQAQGAYQNQLTALRRQAYGNAVRERLKLAAGIGPRPSDDLRAEERQTVYGKLVRRLELTTDPHLDSELIRQIFDVDEMLYFAVPEYWRQLPAGTDPDTATTPGEFSLGRYPVPPAPDPSAATDPAHPLAGQTVASWYSNTDTDNAWDARHHATPEWRVDYLITEDTRPAPMGSSLGWLIQLDGDERRNEFLNAAWAKAVLPVRPGHELDALAWLAQAQVEGEAGLDQPYPFQPGDPAEYQGKTLGQVLTLLAKELQTSNGDIANALATERVFEHGFDPLDGGFRPAQPYQIFDQWTEVLPTDQVVAVQVQYDPRTGQQLPPQA